MDYQAPPFMGFSWQAYWSGLSFPSPGDLPDPGIKPGSPALEADTLTSEQPGRKLPYSSYQPTLPPRSSYSSAFHQMQVNFAYSRMKWNQILWYLYVSRLLFFFFSQHTVLEMHSIVYSWFLFITEESCLDDFITITYPVFCGWIPGLFLVFGTYE